MYKFITALTLSRILLAPLILAPWVFSGDGAWYFSSFIFTILSLTDFADGYLARKHKLTSDFGKFFDPIGDKVMVLFALVLLTVDDLRAISPYFILVILTRDLLVNGLRAYAASSGVVIAARPLGKYKASLQMVAIPLLLLPIDALGLPTYAAGRFVLIISVFFSITSAFDYVLSFRKRSVDR